MAQLILPAGILSNFEVAQVVEESSLVRRFAESFNAKIKAFIAVLRGVTDINFFLFRLTKLYA